MQNGPAQHRFEDEDCRLLVRDEHVEHVVAQRGVRPAKVDHEEMQQLQRWHDHPGVEHARLGARARACR